MLDLRILDLEVLNSLYETEKESLIHNLVHGMAWEDTSEQRMKVAELSVILYDKLNAGKSPNPAEGPLRRTENRFSEFI
jgi:hypothetical protein